MELDSADAHGKLPEDEKDRLSLLPDDVLLFILVRVDLRTAARTSALSTRWRMLPWLLPDLDIDVDDFLPSPCSQPIAADAIHDAMLSVTAATTSLFARPRRQSIVASLQLTLYSIHTFSRDIGPLVCDAIDRGLLKDLHLAVLDEKDTADSYSPTYMMQLADELDRFFGAYPSVFHCLTRLLLSNVCFLEIDMHHILFECCTQLTHLSLAHCNAGFWCMWKIDAPNSKLNVLELDTCSFERIELDYVPKLEKLHCHRWLSDDAPLSFGFVPSLGELHLGTDITVYQHALKLSDLLYGTKGMHTLTLHFLGEIPWMQPEMKQLSDAFSQLRMLSILGIFVEFDMMWTIALLVAAPSVEILNIKVWEHACDLDGEDRPQKYHERINPQWEMDFRGSKNLLLRDLQFVCFRPLKQQLAFIRALLERAPNLQKIVLRDEPCEKCDALGLPPRSSAEHVFPKSKDEQEAVVRRVTDGLVFSGQVIFDT